MNLSEAQHTLKESEARLNIAIGLLQDAWHRLNDDAPGFPAGHEAGSGDTTQPERTHLTRDQAFTDHRALQAALRDNLRTSTLIYDITSRWGIRRIDVEGQLPVEWCVSCYRDNRHCEPAARGRYKGLCRWCGDWQKDYEDVPPLKIVEARHRGQRITTAMAEREVAVQRAERARQKAAKKRKKAS